MDELDQAYLQLADAAARLELANFYAESMDYRVLTKRHYTWVLRAQIRAQKFYDVSSKRYQQAWMAMSN